MSTQTKTKEWEKVRIDECFNVQQGKQVSKKNRIGENQKPFLRTANVFWGKLDLSVLDQMNFTPEEEKKYALQKGDLLVCEGGDIGRSAMWNEEISGCYYQNHLHRLRKMNDDIDENFALLYLQYAFVYANLYFGRANITTIPNLSKSRLSELEIARPPIGDQKAIARVLTTIQNAITKQEELVAKLKELKQGMMHQLFTKGTKGEKTKMTEIGEVPESWNLVDFGKFAEFKNGINFSKSQKGNKGIKTIDVYNMYGGDRTNVKLGDLYKVNKNIKNDYFLKNGDILFVRSSLKQEGVGWACCFNSSSEEVYSFCGFIIRARLNTTNFNPEFLTLYFRSDIARRSLISGSGKVAITNINQGVLSNLKIPMPESGEQNEIANSIFSIDQKIEVLQEKISIYQNLFKTLLHELMTGERRVKF